MPSQQRTRRTILVVFGVLAALVVLSAVVEEHFVREDSDGEILWNSNEAYIFITTNTNGIHPRYVLVPWLWFREWVRAPNPASDFRFSGTVIHVTSTTIERRPLQIEVEDHMPFHAEFYTPMEGRIYAQCRGGVLCRWNGDQFGPVSPEESRRLGGTDRLNPAYFQDVDGWSKQGIARGPYNIFPRTTVKVGSEFTIREKAEPLGDTGYVALALILERPNRPPQRIWEIDGHPRTVSKSEYELTFAAH